jgi:hypothetical protein
MRAWLVTPVALGTYVCRCCSMPVWSSLVTAGSRGRRS